MGFVSGVAFLHGVAFVAVQDVARGTLVADSLGWYFPFPMMLAMFTYISEIWWHRGIA